MATKPAPPVPSWSVLPDTLITIKLQYAGNNRKVKFPLKDLTAAAFDGKLRSVLDIPAESAIHLERWSDSSAAFSVLDTCNPSSYKQLYRAAKAKLKLRIKVTVPLSGANAASGSDKTTSDAGTQALLSRPVSVSTAPISVAPKPAPAVVAPPPPPPQPIPMATEPLPKLAYAPRCEPPVLSDICGLSSSRPAPSKLVSIPITSAESLPATKSAMEVQDTSAERESGSRMSSQPTVTRLQTEYSVYCNRCATTMAGEHFHCSICDNGDYDLCSECVKAGHHCPDADHWLIKRRVVSGDVVNSTTETVPPRSSRAISSTPLPDRSLPKQAPIAILLSDMKNAALAKQQAILSAEPSAAKAAPPLPTKTDAMPGSFQPPELKSTLKPFPARTCNCCVTTMSEALMITCQDCEDYDLCISCHLDRKHGHHPAHAFKMISTTAKPSTEVTSLCGPGRGRRHAAICDGCNTTIYGVRHKCLDCPDWDYCTKCHASAHTTHAGHRFAPLYEPIAVPYSESAIHWGIYCDGPLCKGRTVQGYIKGTRYKCAICHDTDFCAACEAHPTNKHSSSHPVIKFRTEVSSVSVTTIEETVEGSMKALGDMQPSATPAAAADIKSADVSSLPPAYSKADTLKESSSPVALQGLNKHSGLPEMDAAPVLAETALEPSESSVEAELDARFVIDTVMDGSLFEPDTVFVQTWTLINPGPHDWPVGCSVRLVGGDNMLNLSLLDPVTIEKLGSAQCSRATTGVIKPGETHAFSVVLRTPLRKGKHISYWRLKTADGLAFGQKLWCDIKVDSSKAGEGSNNQLLAAFQRREAIKKLARRPMSAGTNASNAKDREDEEPMAYSPPSSAASNSKVQDIPVGIPESVSGSTMVFPKLDKESPMSSTHESAHTAEDGSNNDAKEVLSRDQTSNSSSAANKADTASEDVDDFEFHESEAEHADIEEVEDDEDEEEDAFLTDEEYDILDASDEEIIKGVHGL